MLENRHYKKEIIIALTVILLCVISVTGTTFALFTSNLNDGTIGVNVTSGNVEVDIQDTEGKTLVGDVLDFVTTGTNDTLYWEPGATFYTQGFKVANIGNIPVKFKAYIEDGNEDTKLIEALEFYVTDDLKNIKGAQRLSEFGGRLEVGESSKTYYLVVHMKEDANDDYQGLYLTGVGITVLASQGNVNVDSMED